MTDHSSVAANEEFVKIPADWRRWVSAVGQERVEAVLFVAFDRHLAEHREGDAIIDLTKLGNFFVRSWLLVAEVI